MHLASPISQIPKINKTVLAELHRLEINTIAELLFYFPYRYEDFSDLKKIGEIQPGEQISIQGEIASIQAHHALFGRMGRTEAVIKDATGHLRAVWFNQPYLAESFNKGEHIFLSGTARSYKGIQLQNPLYEKVEYEESNPNAAIHNIHTARIIPIYRLTAKLPLRTLRRAIHSVLPFTKELKEDLPEELLKKQNFMPISETIQNIHFPENADILERAKTRIAFQEIFAIQLAVQKHKQEMLNQKAEIIKFNKHLITQFLGSLTFDLTKDQKKALWDILQDLEKPRPMSRLLEGDVGSGKTLVVFIAALEALMQNMQVVLLCPTEILAQQHYKNALKYFEAYPNISLMLLTAKVASVNGQPLTKKFIQEELAHGGPQFAISTHAILQKDIQFKKLALVIIDEQHRFGVAQRAALLSLTGNNGPKASAKVPHLLSMSATPIPRSLKLSFYGDLDISQIRQMPPGRKPIFTKLVAAPERTKAYEFIDSQIKAGRQVFVVTPRIEENDNQGVKAAESEFKNLQKIFPNLTIGLLHGRMAQARKEQIMADFVFNKVNILVSTAVIEVGIDVPNAAVMVIEGAERFGLAQLHQFRGRVGRAEHQSYCLLFTESANPAALSRLQKFAQTLNGFELAEIDLQTRGHGNIYGTEQSGYAQFRYFSFSSHFHLLEAAKEWSKKIIAEDPQLKNHPALRQMIASKTIHLE